MEDDVSNEFQLINDNFNFVDIKENILEISHANEYSDDEMTINNYLNDENLINDINTNLLSKKYLKI